MIAIMPAGGYDVNNKSESSYR